MILRVINNTFHYEAENLCRVFFPFEKIKVVKDSFEGTDRFIVCTYLSNTSDGRYSIRVSAELDERSSEKNTVCRSFDGCELAMATLMFEIFREMTGYRPPWGVLTGVRPSKLMNSLIDLYSEDGAKAYFKNKLRVLPAKTELAAAVAERERKIMGLSSPESFSLYVSVPFCPSRCSYCSFVSHSVEKAGKLIPEYVDKLCEEIEITGRIAGELGLRLESVYWGGGTPTTLEPDMLDRVCSRIEKCFNLSTIREYTVEAGRADTVTAEKLRVLKAHGVRRISINPQTFNDSVLEAIGRKHTVRQVFDAFSLARAEGFDNVNMDLIAGLTGDTVDSFRNSVDTAVSLKPENITLHTLALKRSSSIVTGGLYKKDEILTDKMLEYAAGKFNSGGYFPYYMYRQSKSVGNLENVGWCLEGFECLYNIFMMEECHTVLAVGAGAVTKLKEPDGRNIERIFNFKYPYEYNTRFGELMERKKRIVEFYNEIS